MWLTSACAPKYARPRPAPASAAPVSTSASERVGNALTSAAMPATSTARPTGWACRGAIPLRCAANWNRHATPSMPALIAPSSARSPVSSSTAAYEGTTDRNSAPTPQPAALLRLTRAKRARIACGTDGRCSLHSSVGRLGSGMRQTPIAIATVAAIARP